MWVSRRKRGRDSACPRVDDRPRSRPPKADKMKKAKATGAGRPTPSMHAYQLQYPNKWSCRNKHSNEYAISPWDLEGLYVKSSNLVVIDPSCCCPNSCPSPVLFQPEVLTLVYGTAKHLNRTESRQPHPPAPPIETQGYKTRSPSSSMIRILNIGSCYQNNHC